MTNLKDYLRDGANYQARAVLMLLQDEFIIEESWNSNTHQYEANAFVARWENCREQGYVVRINDEKRNQLNIAFFEHRSSDSIRALKWEQNGLNSLTIDTANYTDKFDTSYSVGYGEVLKMAQWIAEELKEFWLKGQII